MSAQRETSCLNLEVAQAVLFSTLENASCQGRLVAIRRLSDLQERLEQSYRLGLLDEEFFQERLTGFVFNPADYLLSAQSLMIVAYPHPQMRITFTWNGKPLQLVIPPTYLHDKEGDQKVHDLLAATLEPMGYRITEALLPKKLLAVCSGLGAYGKNNICYVGEMGSFVRLAAFYSDFPWKKDNWREPQMMEACQRCSACGNKCPTGAIPEDRFLLRAERCITYHNEKPSHVPFPTWLDPSWHNCLVGCMTCQWICPKNKDFLHNVEDGATFSQEEAELLLRGSSLDQLPTALAKKIKQFDLVDFLDIFPRNLSVLLT